MSELQPGIYQDVSFPEYNALPYVRNSYLKILGSDCPAAAQLPVDGDKKPLIIGRATHALTLEGKAAFDKDFIVTPADAPKKATSVQEKAAKPSPAAVMSMEWWSAFRKLAGDKEIISADDYLVLKELELSVKSHPFARQLLTDGLSEQTAIFDMNVNGVDIRCKIRPDRTPSAHTACLIDLKSCADASYRGFMNACHRFGYFHQAAIYIDGYNKALEVMFKDHDWKREEHPPIDAFVFIAVEKTAPYRVEVYTMTGDNTLLIEGREQYLQNLSTEIQCRKNDFYPNFQDAGAQELVPYSER